MSRDASCRALKYACFSRICQPIYCHGNALVAGDESRSIACRPLGACRSPGTLDIEMPDQRRVGRCTRAKVATLQTPDIMQLFLPWIAARGGVQGGIVTRLERAVAPPALHQALAKKGTKARGLKAAARPMRCWC